MFKSPGDKFMLSITCFIWERQEGQHLLLNDYVVKINFIFHTLQREYELLQAFEKVIWQYLRK